LHPGSGSFKAMSQYALERRFPGRPEDLSRAMTELGSFLESANIGGHAAYVANLAFEELATNTLKYGYDDNARHEIVLRVEVKPGVGIRLSVQDDGHAFDPLEFPEPRVDLPAEERAPGGLGILLVRKLADRMEYRRADGRNEVTVEISLADNKTAC
jgi:serine/threonine-protein kinase RsbW